MSERRLQPNGPAQQIEELQNGLRVVRRTIVAAYIFSSDGLVVMGRPDPPKEGTSPDTLYPPGGGKKPGETLVQAGAREVREEVIGLDLTEDDFKLLPIIAEGARAKRLKSGEIVWQKEVLYHIGTRLDKPAEAYDIQGSSDLPHVGWYDEQEALEAEKIPLGNQLMEKARLVVS